MSYKVCTFEERPDLHNTHMKIGDRVWPEFMGWDAVIREHWDDLDRIFPEYQFVLLEDNEAVGIANSIPFHLDMPLEELPEEGWDWVVVKGLKDKAADIKPNTLSGLQVAVDTEYQGRGISPVIVREMLSIARQKGYKYMAIPVRPTLKSMYPLIPFANYIRWKTEDGLPFDPWIRVHVKLGARIIKPCYKSMCIKGSISEWEKWTGMKFPETGEYIVEGALTPIKIDCKKDIGEYIEPNVWIVHDILP